ncbi:MAG TPA: TlpA disulfide reductase family protein [Acidobacteriota bacterium]|jgi:thiol-disulfide isomerase/thioredoxin
MKFKIGLLMAAAVLLLGGMWWIAHPGSAHIAREAADMEKAMKAEFAQWQQDGNKGADARLRWKKMWEGFALKYPDSPDSTKAHLWILTLMNSLQDGEGLAAYLKTASRYPDNHAVPEILSASVPLHLEAFGLQATRDELSRIASATHNRENEAAARLMLANIEQDDTRRVEALNKFLASYGNTKIAGEARSAIEELKLTGVGAKAPAFDFTDLAGRKIALEDLRGKWVLLDFWATWCGPCQIEIPHMKAIHAEFGGDGRFAMVGISLDHNKDDLLKMLKDLDMKWPQYFDGKGWENRISQLYRVTSIPDTFLIDPEGKIRYKEMRGAELRKILAEKLGS